MEHVLANHYGSSRVVGKSLYMSERKYILRFNTSFLSILIFNCKGMSVKAGSEGLNLTESVTIKKSFLLQ